MRAVWGHAVDLAYYNLQAGHHVLHGTEVSARGACMHASTGSPHIKRASISCWIEAGSHKQT